MGPGLRRDGEIIWGEKMAGLNDLIDGDVQRLATGFTFTEGPVYHPDGFWYFVDVREPKFYRIKPGEPAELVFDMLPLSQVFPRGHRLRLTVTNADPREKDRETITPAPSVSLLRDQAHASFVTLPVISQTR